MVMMMMMMMRRKTFRLTASASMLLQCRGMVNIHGNNQLHHASTTATNPPLPPPPDPNQLLTNEQLEEQVDRLLDWWNDGTKNQVLCLTGAGISTDSGIPDYRGHNGSYHKGHKPMVHDQFMKSHRQRQRYWARGMVGWRSFDEKQPNQGHFALAKLEEMGKLGVVLEDRPEFHAAASASSSSSLLQGGLLLDDHLSRHEMKKKRLALITQNVDSLHRRAGSKHLVELHGRNDRLACMSCGMMRGRRSFHSELELLNREWLDAAMQEEAAAAASSSSSSTNKNLRPDGDASLISENYDGIQIPSCTRCSGFFKPDVVFFGDAVPSSRVALCSAAVEKCDGLLVVGSSLAVHSAFRHVRAAHSKGIPVAILNVGQTRAESEGLTENVLKLNAPAGAMLDRIALHFSSLSQRQDTQRIANA